MRLNSVFIAGTDTGVGKTVLTGALAAYFHQKGHKVGVMKPVESGYLPGDPHSDAYFLKKMAGVDDALSLISPYTLPEPLAPGVAAQRAGIQIEFSKIQTAYQDLSQRHEMVLVEGAGGLVVPLNCQKTLVDLIQLLNLPVLLIARLGLGTINHTLLSVDYLAKRNIQVVGIVLNQETPQVDLSAQLNPMTLSQWTSVPVWGYFPHEEKASSATQFANVVKTSLESALQKYWPRIT